MENNLEELIIKSGLTKVEFGILAFKMPHQNEKEIQAIRIKINRYCKKDLKTVHLKLLDKFCSILKTDYNTLYGYAKPQ